MARKTNKTAHVLDLISKAKETNQTDETDELDDDISIDTIEQEITSDLTFVDSQMATDMELSDRIKDNLEQEVELQQETEQQETQEVSKEQVEEQEEIKQEAYTIQTKKRDFHVEPLPELDAEETFVTAEQVGIQTNPSATSVAVDGEEDYCYINVLEQIVRERAPIYMKRFGVCTCSRCIADTTAVALNGLPAKYIVTSKHDVSPLMNYFSNYYSGSVIAQLSRACLIVKENPHHSF